MAVTHQTRVRPAGDLLTAAARKAALKRSAARRRSRPSAGGPTSRSVSRFCERLQQAGESAPRGERGRRRDGSGRCDWRRNPRRASVNAPRVARLSRGVLGDRAPHGVLDGPGVVAGGEMEAVRPLTIDRPEVVAGRETWLRRTSSGTCRGAVRRCRSRGRGAAPASSPCRPDRRPGRPTTCASREARALGAVGIEARLEHRRDDLARELRPRSMPSMIRRQRPLAVIARFPAMSGGRHFTFSAHVAVEFLVGVALGAAPFVVDFDDGATIARWPSESRSPPWRCRPTWPATPSPRITRGIVAWCSASCGDRCFRCGDIGIETAVFAAAAAIEGALLAITRYIPERAWPDPC